MSKYSIEITTSAQRQFKKLPQGLQDRILPKLFELEIHPRPFGTKKLADSDFTASESEIIELFIPSMTLEEISKSST